MSEALQGWQAGKSIPSALWAQALAGASTPALDIVRLLAKHTPTAPLAEALSDADPALRLTAVAVLERLGELAPVELVVQALNDSDHAVRERAVSVMIFSRKSGPAEPVIQALRGDLSGSNEGVRAEAYRKLGYLGEEAPIDLLVEALGDASAYVRRHAATSLGYAGEQAPLEPLVQALDDPDSDVCAAAAEALGYLGERAPIDVLREALGRTFVTKSGAIMANGQVRGGAVKGLAHLGARAPLELIIGAWGDESRLVRAAVLDALGYLGEWAPLEPLVQALCDPDRLEWAQVGTAAVRTLPRLADRLPVEVLIQATNIHGDSLNLLPQAVRALARRADQVPVDFWLEALTNANWQVSVAAVEVLGRLGEHAPIDRLVEALGSSDRRLRYKAAEALGLLAEHAPVAPVVQALSDADIAVRWYAAKALGRIGDRSAIEPLIHALDDPDPALHVLVAGALAQLGEQEHHPIGLVLQGLTDRSNSVRLHAIDALEQLGEQVPTDPLVRALGDPDHTVRWRAAQALDNRVPEQLAEVAAEAISIVCHQVQRIDDLPILAPLVHMAIIDSISSSELPDFNEIEYLLYLLDWPHGEVQVQAIWALGGFSGNLPEAAIARLETVRTTVEQPSTIRDAADRVLTERWAVALMAQLADTGPGTQQQPLEPLLALSGTDLGRFMDVLFSRAGYWVEDVTHERFPDGRGVALTLRDMEASEGSQVIGYVEVNQQNGDHSLDAETVIAFVEALDAHTGGHTVSGYFLTTSDFTEMAQAEATASRGRVTLVNGEEVLHYITAVYTSRINQAEGIDEDTDPLPPK